MPLKFDGILLAVSAVVHTVALKVMPDDVDLHLHLRHSRYILLAVWRGLYTNNSSWLWVQTQEPYATD